MSAVLYYYMTCKTQKSVLGVKMYVQLAVVLTDLGIFYEIRIP